MSDDEIAKILRFEDDLNEVKKLLQAEQAHNRVYRNGETVAQSLRYILDEKRSIVAANVQRTRVFQEDVLSFLRAFSLMLETVANASTHAEKAARLRGLIELVQSAATKVRQYQVKEVDSWRFSIYEDVFHVDYPVRHWIEKTREAEKRAHDAETELQRLMTANGELSGLNTSDPGTLKPLPEDDRPF